tara:strand:+ start:16384 stop:17265 length:882 start_codon:yes stop_codon:yes gene_type:complete
MQLTQNQFFGKDSEKENMVSNGMAAGATFTSTDVGRSYIIGDNGRLLDVSQTDTFDGTYLGNDSTRGLEINLIKNTTGTDWAANLTGAKIILSNISTGRVNGLQGNVIRSINSGTGETSFITGTNQTASHEGSGLVYGLYGNYSSVKSSGSNTQTIDYMIGDYNNIRLDNANATVNNLGALNAQLSFNATMNVGEVYVCLLDINATNSGSNSVVSGDLSFLCIKDHPTLPVVNGTARAIHSLSTLPSELSGSVQANGLIDSAITEHADNAAAVAAGLATGTHYRTGDDLKIVH